MTNSTFRGHSVNRIGLFAGPWLPVALLVVACTATVVWPGLVVAWTVLRGAIHQGLHSVDLIPSLPLLARTFAWAGGIGVLSAVLAWPGAWLIRRRGWAVAPVILVPLLLPSYLAYSAYGLLRAPGTSIGDWIELAAQGGLKWLPTVAGEVLAVGGLSLWAWPIAAIVLGASVSRLDEGVLESLRLENMSAPRRWLTNIAMVRWGLVAGAGLVTLVMFGSAVPLHLAQVPTYSVKVWFDMTMDPGGWRVWVGAWPLVAVAAGAGWFISRAVARQLAATSDAEPARQLAASSRTAGIATLAVWALSVLVPLALFAGSLRDGRSIPRFWRLQSDSIWQSLAVAAAVALIGLALTLAVWAGLSVSRTPRPNTAAPSATLWCIRALLAAGLLPGVLVGAAISAAIQATEGPTGMDWLADSPAVMVLAHVARFGFVPALVGYWLYATEPPSERDLRRIDGAEGLSGWCSTCLPTQAGTVAGAALGSAALSLHEVETAVILQPPGTASLAQTILGYLHFARMEEMSAAAVILVGGGLLLALAAAGLASRTIGKKG